MSSVPPPPPGGPVGPPPWQTGQVLAAPAPKPGSNTPKLVAAFVAVAVLAGGGVYLLTRNGGGDKSVAPATVPETDATIPPTTPRQNVTTTAAIPTTPAPIETLPPQTTTVAPTTTQPSTSVAPTTTPPPPTATVAPTTVPFVLPAGAVDLGHQVFIVAPAGWTDRPSANGNLHNLADASGDRVSAQVLARRAGEDPKTLLQAYFDAFDANFEPVSVAPGVQYADAAGPIPASAYGVYYNSWDRTANDNGVAGTVYVFQRGDGLSVIYDIYSSASATMGTGSIPLKTLFDSLTSAPATGPVGPLTKVPSFRLTTKTAPLFVDSMIAFTPAPGFEGTPGDGNNYAQATNADYSFEVSKLTGQATLDAALQHAEDSLKANFTGLTFTAAQPFNPASGLTHEGAGWHATFSNGQAVTGAIDVYFDTKTSNAISVMRDWYTTPAGTEPHPAESSYMITSIADEVLTAGIP
jgi:hypothetical protein